MNQTFGTFLEYEAAYRAERLRGEAAPRRAERRRPAGARGRRRVGPRVAG